MGRFLDRPFFNIGLGGSVAFLIVTLSILLAGCGGTSFVGRQYDNFTAYYNKFHNAEKAFDEASTSIKESQRPVDRSAYLSVFFVPTSGGDNAAFEEVIQKSADILREHPNSKWVDDALLLIGKSYFFEGNYVGAAQKFREVIALEGEREGEAHFWLARTLVATERFSEAAEALRNGLNDEDFGTWTARMYLVRGDLLSKQEQWEEAVPALRRGLRGELPDEVGARAAFLLGQIHETLDQPSQARAAYRHVLEYDPPYELDFAARLSEIELQGAHGNATKALERLEELESDDKNFDMRGEMAVLRAQIYREQGELDRARRTLTSMLYSSDRPTGDSRGQLHYALANLYRDGYDDFSRAAAHFDTASTSVGAAAGPGNTDVRRLPDAPTDASVQAERYRRLAERASEVARLDSLLRLGRMDDQEFRTFVAELREERRAAQKERQEEADAAQRSQRFGGGRRSVSAQKRGPAAANTRTSDAGFLFHQDPARVQQGRREFERTWGERPRVDNWRRRTAIRSQETASTAQNDGQPTADRQGEDSAAEPAAAPSLDLSAIPRDSASQAEMEAERAVARYEFANSLFLAAGRPDSAATWYRRIVRENSEHRVARRAMYALAEAQRAKGDTTAAQDTYRRLLNRYPESNLAARARERLAGRSAPQSAKQSALADSAYARAYRLWKTGRVDRALHSMLQVADQYPGTTTAPRALLAGSVIYWRMLNGSGESPISDSLETRLAAFGSPDSVRVSSPERSPDRTDTSVPPVPADSVGTPDQGGTRESIRPADSVQTAVDDSAAVGSPETATQGTDAADSLSVARRDSTTDSTTVAGDSSRAARYDRLKGLLAHIAKTYPDAPQGRRAQSMLELLEEKQARADSVAADTSGQNGTPRDTTVTAAVTQSAATSDSTRRSVVDSTTTGTGRREAPPSSGAPASVREEEDSPPSTGQNRTPRERWTLRVESYADSAQARTRETELRRRVEGVPVDVVKRGRGSTVEYTLVVGRFDTREEAVQAHEHLVQMIPSGADVGKIPGQKERDD